MVLSNCTSANKNNGIEYVYKVSQLTQSVVINSNWDKNAWNQVPELYLGNYMGEKPSYWPDVYAKIAYDTEAIYLIFQVDDKFVRCVVDEYQGPVYTDSCVEFFFVPGSDISEGYFNLEVNCGGTALFAFQKERGIDRINIPINVFNEIDLAHSMPRIVEPEITERVTWTIEYRIPFDILTEFTNVTHPEPGVEWKANFYKIGDETSNPHWLTWSFVNHPVPDFHKPEYFGSLIFE